MQPITITQEQYESGDYPKGVPIMVSMSVGMDGKGGMSVGRKAQEARKITISLKKND